MGDTNMETAYNFMQYLYFNLSGKTPKTKRFAIEDTNSKTVYNCRQLQYFNF